MATLIVFRSMHGCVESLAGKLQESLKDDAVAVNLKTNSHPALEGYDTVIVGGSIHAGKVQGSVKTFCEKNLDTLLQKKVGLFLSCMEEGDSAQMQFDNAFPEQLREHAAATGLFGGAFNFEKMNFFVKAIIKKMAKTDKSVSKIDEKAIGAFVETMNGA